MICTVVDRVRMTVFISSNCDVEVSGSLAGWQNSETSASGGRSWEFKVYSLPTRRWTGRGFMLSNTSNTFDNNIANRPSLRRTGMPEVQSKTLP